jgi:hypothetical protein
MTGYDILSYSRKISKYLGSVKKIPDYAVILTVGGGRSLPNGSCLGGSVAYGAPPRLAPSTTPPVSNAPALPGCPPAVFA